MDTLSTGRCLSNDHTPVQHAGCSGSCDIPPCSVQEAMVTLTTPCCTLQEASVSLTMPPCMLQDGSVVVTIPCCSVQGGMVIEILINLFG